MIAPGLRPQLLHLAARIAVLQRRQTRRHARHAEACPVLADFLAKRRIAARSKGEGRGTKA